MKIDVIHLQSRFIPRSADAAIRGTVDRARERGHDIHYPNGVFGSAMISHSRNHSLKVVRPDSDFVLFVDDDMLPVPSALVRLVGHAKPVVSALCVTRQIPCKICAKHYNQETGEFSLIADIEENTLVKGPWGIGFGFVLIQTKVLFRVIDYVLGAHDWIALGRREHDRLKVRMENRLAEQARIAAQRQKVWEAERIAPVFQLRLHDELQHEIAEDMHFSRLLREMGVDVWIDSGCLVGHLGEFPFSPLNLGMKHPAEVQMV